MNFESAIISYNKDTNVYKIKLAYWDYIGEISEEDVDSLIKGIARRVKKEGFKELMITHDQAEAIMIKHKLSLLL